MVTSRLATRSLFASEMLCSLLMQQGTPLVPYLQLVEFLEPE